MADPTNNDTLIASARNGVRPYGPGTQVLVIGIHGTENTPSNVTNVTNTIGRELQSTTNGPVLVNSSFDWRARHEIIPTPEGSVVVPVAGTAHLRNGSSDRGIASKEFAKHVLANVDYAYESGGFSKDKPLVINLAGFSHGGNVAIQAIDEIAAGLKKRGLNEEAGIHLTTMSTPAYNGRRSHENPNGTARAAANNNGVSFAHTAFAVPGDGVIKAAWGSDTYTNNTTRNYPIHPAQNGIQHTITNHGLAQDDANVMNGIAGAMANRFRGLAPANTRVSDNTLEDRQIIASAKMDITAKDFGERGNHFNQALSAANGNADVAAAVVRSSAAAGHNPKEEINVAVSNKDGALIATQGVGPGVNRAEPVLASQVQQGTAQNVAEALMQKNLAPQVAAVEPQAERQQQAPRTV